jgi:limonene-1,2-epoxide hydrolase
MEPIDTVRAFIAAIERKDLDAAIALLADDVEYDNVPMTKVHGHDGVRGLLEPLLAGSASVEWVVHREVATGPVVMNERVDRFDIGERWLEIPVAGVWEVHDGRITLWRDYFDMDSFNRQLG